MRLIWRWVRGVLAWVGFLALLLVAAGVGLAVWVGDRLAGTADLPDRMVLAADLREPLPEARGRPDLLGLELRPEPTVSEVVLALGRAASDPRVEGFVAVVDETEHGLAVTQELRDAIARFRAAGKPAFAWADSFGELGPGNQGYYLAAAFDEIWLQPAGLVGLTGLAIEQPFLGGLLAKLGIGFETVRRSEYKSALENVAAREISEPNREMLLAVLEGLNGQLAGGIARGRRLEPARAAELLAGGPYTAADALRLGLVDGVGYREEAVERATARAGGAPLVPFRDFMAATRGTDGGAAAVATVAVVQAAGPIVRGPDGGLGVRIAAEDLAEAVDDAAEDATVDALVLRLSSPGGSPAASETLARAVRRAVRGGKPVVVSMGDVAASGGYWTALGASRIVAQPATLTGSIGVISGKPVLEELWRRLEVSWATLSPPGGREAPLFSPNRPFAPDERAKLDALVGELYRDFKQRVADARGIPVERVEELARGRVWTGEAAASLRLVDRLGGLHEALLEARGLLGLPADVPLEVVLRPEPPWAVGRLLGEVDWALRAAAGLRAAAAAVEAGLAGAGIAAPTAR